MDLIQIAIWRDGIERIEARLRCLEAEVRSPTDPLALARNKNELIWLQAQRARILAQLGSEGDPLGESEMDPESNMFPYIIM